MWWLFDLVAHFRVQYAAGMLLVTALGAALRTRYAFLALALALVNVVPVIPSYFGDEPAGPRALTILSANVLSSNYQADSVLPEVIARRPDIFVVLELSEDFAATLAAKLPEEYRWRMDIARADNFGIGVYARVPIAFTQHSFDEIGGIPTIVGTTERGITVIATHPLPPAGGAGSARRDAQLRAIAAYVSGKGATVVVGDLNTTPWAHSFGILEDAGLHDTRRGFGLQASWPAGFFPLAIPIDHCLATGDLLAAEREVLDDIGSDHYPIYVELRWARAPD